MKHAIQKIAGKWWIITVGLALVAIAGLRANAASAPTPPEDYKRIRYMCVGDLAVDMTGRHEMPMARELGLDSPDQRAFEGCHLPLVPLIAGSRFWASGTAPSTGLGGMVVEVDTAPTEALDQAKAALEGAGWAEQGASALMGQRKPSRALMTFERQGAWLWVVAIPTGGETTKSTVLMAGQFSSHLWRTK